MSSEYIPLVSWETKLIDVQPVLAEPFHYICKVASINPNDYAPNTLGTSQFYVVDYTGKIYEITEIVDVPTKTIKIYDLLEDADEGPYISESAYVYQTRTGINTLTQAQRKRLHPTAFDQIWNIENNIIQKSPIVDYIDFNTVLDNPDYTEGRVFWDKSKNALSYYNEIDDITVNLGQEFLIPVYNNTASTMSNGSVVYPTGSHTCTDGIVRHTVDLANARYKDKSRMVAVTTHEIASGECGYVTRLGSVGGLNTVGLNGILYLSADTPGAFTNIMPDDGCYIIPIGAVKVIDAIEGSITVDPKSTELTVEVTDTNGFPSTQRTNTILSFNDATREFTIAASSYPFHYYDEGIKYEKEESETIEIADTEGLHVFYYEGDTLTTLANPNDGEIDALIRTACIVAYIYWDATNNVHSYFGDERHGISMDPNTHTYLHFTRGAQYLYGLGLGDILVDESGSLDSHAQFSIEGGMCADEDITTTYSAIASTVGLPIYYLDGASGDMRRTTQSGFSVKVTGTGRVAWNEWTGATWQLTEVTDGKYVLTHVFAINGMTGTDQQIAVIGQTEYATSTLARAAASTEISNVLTRFPFEEIVPVATVIFQTKDSYTNSINARIISTDTGEDYINWLTTELAQGSAVTSHSNLTNLTADDHAQYALLAGRSGDILKIDELQEFTSTNGIKVDGLIIKDTGINFEVGATTRIFKDGSNNLSFTDAVTGTKTLAQLADTGGDVYKVGTPVDNQIGVWTGDGTIEGDSDLLWDGSKLTIASLEIEGFYISNATESDNYIYIGDDFVEIKSIGTGLQIFGDVSLITGNLLFSGGSIATTAARVLKGWFTDLEITNMPTVGGVPLVSSQWVTTGSDIYYNTGNVGIGTTSPVRIFDVRVPYAKTDITNRNALLIASNDVSNPAGLNISLKGAATQSDRTALFQTTEYGVVSNGNISLQPYNGNVGIGTTAPGKQLEINSATGACLRLTYNDSNGSAANYTDLAVSSSGDLTITPSGGDADVLGILKSYDHRIFGSSAGGNRYLEFNRSGTTYGTSASYRDFKIKLNGSTSISFATMFNNVAETTIFDITTTGIATVYTGLVPDAHDGAYLGTAALGFSDLYLATGAVITFGGASSADLTLTHATGKLTSNKAIYAPGFIDTFAALTISSSATTWDCLGGLNKTVSASADFTMTLTNFVSGMFGDLKLTITNTPTITLAASGVTFKGNGSIASIPAGIYHFCWVCTSSSTIEWNIAEYE